MLALRGPLDLQNLSDQVIVLRFDPSGYGTPTAIRRCSGKVARRCERVTTHALVNGSTS